jgi:peptide/nickel transport system substrate-binding protein
VPIPNGLWYVALNTSRPPFDNVKLRQAIAWAIPYDVPTIWPMRVR